MTTTTERPRTKSGSQGFVASPPQVNLLPPEIREARGLKAVKRVLALVLVFVVALCAAGFVLAYLDKGTASDDLAEAQAETARLQTEQQQYAEVPRVLGQLDTTKAARQLGMSTEVLWADYYGALAAVLPADVSFDSLAITQATPIAAAAPPSTPLQAPSIGQIAFTARSTTLPNTAQWVDALNSVPGFGDAWVSSASITEDGETQTVYYNVSATVQVRDTAYALRFVPDQEGN